MARAPFKRPPPVQYRGTRTQEQRMTALARSFPCLREAPGVEPWAPNKLDVWAQSAAAYPSQLHCARFVLHVWNHAIRWQSGAFNLGLALSCWDEREREAFSRWAGEPWIA